MCPCCIYLFIFIFIFLWNTQKKSNACRAPLSPRDDEELSRSAVS
jgi:hypothetical protein